MVCPRDNSEDYPEEEFYASAGGSASDKYIRVIPTLHYWQKTYAQSLGGQDQKSVRVFRDYESQEKTRRLQQELMNIKDGKVTDQALDLIVGKKRKMKYGGYDKWAALMLLWCANYKK